MKYLAFPRLSKLNAADFGLLRWVVICLLMLITVLLLMQTGVLYEIELEQVRFLGGAPFFISAQEAQVSLLSVGGMFGICVIVTLYLSLVYLREPRFSGRLQVAAVSTAALAIPGLLCVLWGGVLNMAAPIICSLGCWLLTELDWLTRWYIRHRKNKRNAV